MRLFRIFWFMFASVFLLLGVGLYAGGQSEKTQKADIKAPTKVERINLTAWVGDWWKDKVPLITKEFEQANPGLTIKIELIPNVAYLEKATTAILGGSPPDVLDLGAYMVTTLIGKNLLQPWDEQDIKRLGDLKDFAPGIWSIGLSKGILYAVPNRSSGNVYLYNKNLFDQAGIPYPKEDWTYQDLLEIAKKLSIPGKQFGFGMAASATNMGDFEMTICPMVWAFGGEFFNKDYSACTLDQPNAIAALKFWVELYTKHKVVPEGIANYTLSKDIVQMFATDKVAIMPGGDFAFKRLAEEKAARPNFNFGQQLDPNKINIGGGWSFTVPVSAANPKQARDFIIWFTQPENLGKYMVRQPARMSATNTPPWNTELYGTIIKASMITKPLPITPIWADTEKIILTELQKALENKQTPEDAATVITRQVNQLIKK